MAVGATGGLGGGSVQVITRTPDGFEGSEPIGDDTAGLPGERQRFCAFGFVLAAGDVQGDGRDDLAVGDPSYGCHDDETEFGAGSVVLLPGSSTGLTVKRSQIWTQDSPGVQGTEELGNIFGASLAMGPLNADARDDLVIGAPLDSDDGSVTVLLGGPEGLNTDGLGGTRFTQPTPGIGGTSGSWDGFGSDLKTAYVQGPDQASVIIGVPDEDVGKLRDAGSVTQLSIKSSGPSPRGSRTFTADTRGIKGEARADEHFGDATRRWG